MRMDLVVVQTGNKVSGIGQVAITLSQIIRNFGAQRPHKNCRKGRHRIGRGVNGQMVRL